ncbi:adenylate/guanylate cyclase domain-containing protein [Bacteroidota bacterium]
MKDSLEKKYVNLLVLLQSFEKYWTNHVVSDGELMYQKHCKEEAKKLITYSEEVYKVDKNVYNSKAITLNSDDNEDYVRGIFGALKKWSTNDDLFPTFQEGLVGGHINTLIMGGFFVCEKAYLCRKLKLSIPPIISSSSSDGYYSKNNIRWRGHLPSVVLPHMNQEFINELSDSDTIVLVADIRKSQDLMTYGPSADFFRDKILEFTTEMREIIKNNYGIFDKFTGDGFLCYFNSHLCEQLGKDYYEQLIKACKEIMDFSNSFFSDWVKNIRKLPPNSSGLTIGIDSGVVKFRDLDNHLFAIGESIVWANRMSSAGDKEEIILNNIPYHKINDSQKNIEFESIKNVTKGGESFTAYKMKLNNSC